MTYLYSMRSFMSKSMLASYFVSTIICNYHSLRQSTTEEIIYLFHYLFPSEVSNLIFLCEYYLQLRMWDEIITFLLKLYAKMYATLFQSPIINLYKTDLQPNKLSFTVWTTIRTFYLIFVVTHIILFLLTTWENTNLTDIGTEKTIHQTNSFHR